MAKPVVLVIDTGTFVAFAQAIGQDADVLYYSSYRGFAPESKNALVGRDMPGVQRVDSFWEFIDEADAIAFPDVGDGDLQHWLRDKGYPVFGSGKSDMLELSRYEFKKVLKQLELPVIEGELIVGMENLKRYLKEHEDVYVKVSFFRGDAETFHSINWSLSECWWLELAHRLGPHAGEIEFVVEPPVKAIEIGYDGFCINGKFPNMAAWGVEIKDCCYIGRAQPMSEMPVCIQDTNAAMAEALGALGMQGCFSSEIRIAEDGTCYLNDPTCRCPSPPIACMSLGITNWAEIVIGGAHGELIEPDYSHEYLCEIELTSQWLTKEWMAIEMPPSAEAFVRFRRACMFDGRVWCIPSRHLDIAGSAVGLGDTAEQAIDNAMEIAEQIEGMQLTYDKDAKHNLLEAWDEANEKASTTTEKAA